MKFTVKNLFSKLSLGLHVSGSNAGITLMMVNDAIRVMFADLTKLFHKK